MLRMAWQTMRTRPSAFAGAFVALALGVALIAAAAMVLAAEPEGERVSRYRADTVVVTAPSTVSPAPGRLGGTAGMSADTIEALAGVSGVDSVIADSSIEAGIAVDRHVVDVPDTYLRGHGWSSASFGPYRLADGAAPDVDDEVVLDGRLAAAAGVRAGGEVTVSTEAGPARYRVAGTTRPVDTTEAVVFFTDARAAKLAAGRIDAAVMLPVAGRAHEVAAGVRAVDQTLAVHTGDAVRAAEPDPLADAYAAPAIVLSLMAAISCFVSVFVVAGTFALSVLQRRRELALLRLAGATRRQVRRMVLAEALLVGVAAAAAGCALATPTAHALVGLLRGMDELGLPPRFAPAITPVPFIVATLIGLVVSLLGAWLAVRRAGKIRPLEALRQAAAERRQLSASRLLVGLAALAGGIVAVRFAVRNPDQGYDILVAFGLVVGAAALGPVVVPAVVTLVGAAFGRRAGVTAEVARANLRVQARRTASVAAPVVVLTGLVGSMLASLFTFENAMAGEVRAQTGADLVVIPRAAADLTPPELAGLTGVDGVATVTPVTTTHVYSSGERFTARAVPWTAFDGALRYRLEGGSLADLRGDTVAVSGTVADARDWRLGDLVPIRLDDGTEARPRLVAIFGGPGGYDLLPAILLPTDRVAGHTAAWSVTHALITLRPNANRDAVANAVTGTLAGQGAEAVTRDRWLDDTITRYFDGNRVVLTAILGMAAAYTAIAIVNTLVMAVRERVPDLAQLRLAGGTRRQALRTLLWEGGFVSAVGVGLGLAVTATSLIANTIAVRTVIPAAQPAAPWWVVAVVATCSAALVLVASFATGVAALRRRPIDGLSVPE